eukprot:TRINITY_DN2216_c0_g1_i7.p1 TRINITY_DN2216_c0_g1~~TRINITY_DN2216_c0_g1_i7.p1  ORF type:complete len:1103 (+),score=311.12 TRINITY_DN2216_c0_g1_i7:77-3385(+)
MSLFVALLGGDDKRVLAWYPTQQPPEFAAVLDDVRAQPLPSGHLLRGERLIIFRVVTIQEQRFVFVLSGPVTSSLSSAQLVLGEDKLRKALAGIDPAAVIASPEAYAADLLELLLGIFKQVTFHVPERAPAAAAAQPAQGPTPAGDSLADLEEEDEDQPVDLPKAETLSFDDLPEPSAAATNTALSDLFDFAGLPAPAAAAPSAPAPTAFGDSLQPGYSAAGFPFSSPLGLFGAPSSVAQPQSQAPPPPPPSEPSRPQPSQPSQAQQSFDLFGSIAPPPPKAPAAPRPSPPMGGAAGGAPPPAALSGRKKKDGDSEGLKRSRRSSVEAEIVESKEAEQIPAQAPVVSGLIRPSDSRAEIEEAPSRASQMEADRLKFESADSLARTQRILAESMSIGAATSAALTIQTELQNQRQVIEVIRQQAPAAAAPLPPRAPTAADVQAEIAAVTATMRQNIDQAMLRGERLENLQDRIELAESAISFQKSAHHMRRKAMCNPRLCLAVACFPITIVVLLVAGMAEVAQRGCRAAGGLREKLQAKFKVGSIDDIFADLETVFYHLAELLVGQPVVRFGRRYLSVGCLVWPLVALYRAVAFVLINCFLMGVIMPGIFTLLIFRTKKVEVEKTQMVHRAAVIATESAARKSLRWLGLLSRSLPMTFILAGWPVLIFYHFVPVYGKGEKGEAVGDALVALHVAFVILVQILGTMRVSRAVDARAELAKEKAAEQTAVRDEKLGTFRTNKVGNWIALTSIAVESIQMIVFPMLKSKQELDAESAKSSETEPKDDSLLAYLRTDVFPSFLLRLGPEDVQSGFTWVAIGAVMILIVIFSLQFSFELYTYQNKKIANAGHSEFYFSSFLGAIVYGHGKLGYVKNKVCSVVELLSDTLFLVICNKLILGASCTSSGTCFESETQRLQQVLSLVTFSFYVPLSVMVSPLFLDANSEKDVRFQKTYLMAVNTAKCAMLLFAVILAQWKLSNALSTLLIAFLLFVVTLAWILVRLPSQTVKEALIAPQKPCTIAWINIWRCVSFVAALWSAFCALIFVHTSVASHQAVSVVFLVGLVVLGAAGVVWTYAYTNLHVAAVKRGRMFQKLEENWAEDDQEDAL